jgi:hypothetical protein
MTSGQLPHDCHRYLFIELMILDSCCQSGPSAGAAASMVAAAAATLNVTAGMWRLLPGRLESTGV